MAYKISLRTRCEEVCFELIQLLNVDALLACHYDLFARAAQNHLVNVASVLVERIRFMHKLLVRLRFPSVFKGDGVYLVEPLFNYYIDVASSLTDRDSIFRLRDAAQGKDRVMCSHKLYLREVFD